MGCRGCIVTADAMNTQKGTARAIAKEAHSEYCLALKKTRRPHIRKEWEDLSGIGYERKAILRKERNAQSWLNQKICDVHHKTAESLLSQEHEVDSE